MVRGGCLPVRGSDRMTWKYDDDKCRCGLVETEKHVLFECTLYGTGTIRLIPHKPTSGQSRSTIPLMELWNRI